MVDPSTDLLTVAAISILASMIAVFCHEHLGHALSCALLGGKPTELSAFYVTCDYRQMGETGIRLVAFAGPLASFIIGAVGLLAANTLQRGSAHLRFVLWLLGALGWFTAFGYFLFSGVTGIGDLGTDSEGVFYQASPEILWRAILVIIGVIGYYLAIRSALRLADRTFGGAGKPRMKRAMRLALTTYLAAAAAAILISLPNPQGFIITVISAAAESLGGASALLWMFQMLPDEKDTGHPPLALTRQWGWITVSVVVALAYALVFGPTLRL